MHNGVHLRGTRALTGVETLAGARPAIHVVTTCTDRKMRAVSTELRARALPIHDLAARLRAWTERLDMEAESSLPALELYAGDHWQVVRSMADLAADDVDVHVWICSAGYGLVPWSAPLRAYSATFSATQPDAVVPTSMPGTTVDWWNGLALWTPRLWREGGQRTSDVVAPPRTLQTLARQMGAADFMLVAISAVYERALREDLLDAARSITDQDRLAMFSTGARPRGELRSFHIPTGSHIKTHVGGAMQSLNARLARRALAERTAWFPSRARLGEVAAGWSAAAPPSVKLARVPMSDEDLRTYIIDQRRVSMNVGHTVLLRALRDGGRACEQTRFAKLFREVVSEAVLSVEGAALDSGVAE